MSIPYHVQPNPKRPDQVRLDIRCVSEMQAEAVRRALRRRFQWVSSLMESFSREHSHFLFVTTTENAVRTAWATIETEAETAVASQPANSTVSPSGQSAIPRRTHELEELRTWQRRFRDAVRAVHDEIPRQSVATQEVSLVWVEEQIRENRVGEVEALLGQPLISPSSALRAQVALYSRTEQHEKVINLYETRREELLALPVSGLLVEQIVGAYLSYWREVRVPDALHTAQQIAQIFLPELERLRQADRVRSILRNALHPTERNEDIASAPLSEQIAAVIQIAPAEQIERLEALKEEHTQSYDLQLALGAAYAAAGDIEAAITAYASAQAPDEISRADLLYRHAALLLSAGRYTEATALLPVESTEPRLDGLRGAALYWSRRPAEAREVLERAWEAGDRSRHMLLPLARLRADLGQEDLAVQPYRLLLDAAPELLAAQDYAQIAISLYLSRPEDVSAVQIAEFCDRYVQLGGPRSQPPDQTREILQIRIDLRAAEGGTQWLAAWADWLEWLAHAGDREALNATMMELRSLTSRRAITQEQHFTLLELVEPFAGAIEGLQAALAGEYLSLATDGLHLNLRKNRPLPSYIRDLRRALHFLDRSAADMLAQEIESERQALIKRNEPVPEQIEEHEPEISLANVRLALVGGHEETRREVARELRDRYGLKEAVEVAPSSDARVDRSSVQAKIAGCNFIAVITGYMGHDLSGIVRDLQQAGALDGHVLWLPSAIRGKSGVLREILEAYT